MEANYFQNNAILVTGINTQDFKDIMREVVEEAIRPLKADVTSLIGTTTYTIDEAAIMLGKHKTTIYRYCDAGLIETVKIGQRYAITHTSLQNFKEGKKISHV